MGQKAGKAVFKVSRKAGDPINVRNLPAVHTEFIYPSSKRTMNYAICRCWQSGKFPICDNSHKMLQFQGCDCGPVMLEVRQAPSLTPVGAEWSPPEGTSSSSSSSQNGPTAIAVFGGAASVSALLAGEPAADSPNAHCATSVLLAAKFTSTFTRGKRFCNSLPASSKPARTALDFCDSSNGGKVVWSWHIRDEGAPNFGAERCRLDYQRPPLPSARGSFEQPLGRRSA